MDAVGAVVSAVPPPGFVVPPLGFVVPPPLPLPGLEFATRTEIAALFRFPAASRAVAVREWVPLVVVVVSQGME